MSSFGGDFRLGITAYADLCLAKIPSACVFIGFQLARVGRSRRLLTVKISRHLFNFSAGWSFGEAQVKLRYAALAYDDSAPSPVGEGGTGLNARPSSESEWQPESTATRMTLRPDAHTAGNWIPTLLAHYRLMSLRTERAACRPG